MLHVRHIATDGAKNVRDLGGYPTEDGSCTKWGLLYRSDAVTSLDEAGWRTLEECGIRTVIDLRSNAESEEQPADVSAGMQLFRISLMRQVDEMPPASELAGDGSGISPDELMRIIKSTCVDYGEALRINIDRCAEIMDVILTRLDEGGVLFFCFAGKDRTGIIAAVTLYLCGVLRDDIVADYSLSEIYNREGVGERLKTELAGFGDLLQKMGLTGDALASSPQTMVNLLDEMDAMDVRTMLDANGFTFAKQAQLKAMLVEEA